MNINIKPIEKVAINVNPMYVKVYRDKDVEELEANYKEAINALKNIIDYEIYEAISDKCSTLDIEVEIYRKQIAIIEKATGKKWEDLK